MQAQRLIGTDMNPLAQRRLDEAPGRTLGLWRAGAEALVLDARRDQCKAWEAIQPLRLEHADAAPGA